LLFRSDREVIRLLVRVLSPHGGAETIHLLPGSTEPTLWISWDPSIPRQLARNLGQLAVPVVAYRLHLRKPVMRPTSRLFSVDPPKSEKTAPSARPPLPSVELEVSWDDEAPRGVTSEAWHKARGWASED